MPVILCQLTNAWASVALKIGGRKLPTQQEEPIPFVLLFNFLPLMAVATPGIKLDHLIAEQTAFLASF